MAASLAGASEWRVIIHHMVPSFMSYLIASVTLSIPSMILGETSLSFLGLGLRPPVVSWGVMLRDAQALRFVAQAPWLLLPGCSCGLRLGVQFRGRRPTRRDGPVCALTGRGTMNAARAGWAEVDITPPLGLRWGGAGRALRPAPRS